MRFVFVSLIAGMVMIVGCTKDDRARTAASGEANLNLEHSIEASFAADSDLGHSGLTVTANAEKGEVILRGTVTSEESRTKAVALAKEARPGLQVIDTIEVKPAELARSEYTEVMAGRAREKAMKVGDRLGNSVDDAWLYTKVMTRLTANSGVPALKINLDVTNGVVTLRGPVDSAARKEEAEKIARETEGVKSVDNRLEVRAG